MTARLLRKGWNVTGTYRCTSSPDKLYQAGVQPVMIGETGQIEKFASLVDGSHLLISIPPCTSDEGPDMIVNSHMRDLIGANIPWLGYLSTTGVYGDWAGGLVDESMDTRATSPQLRARLDAETAWLRLYESYRLKVHVFRLAGIYGCGRSALDAVEKATRDDLSEKQRRRGHKRFTSRVHVEDVCQALELSMQNPTPGQIFNIVDDNPAGRAEVLQYAADLLEVSLPASVTSAPMEGSSSEKRVCNRKAKQILGWYPTYPTYREGLRAILYHAC